VVSSPPFQDEVAACCSVFVFGKPRAARPLHDGIALVGLVTRHGETKLPNSLIGLVAEDRSIHSPLTVFALHL